MRQTPAIILLSAFLQSLEMSHWYILESLQRAELCPQRDATAKSGNAWWSSTTQRKKRTIRNLEIAQVEWVGLMRVKRISNHGIEP